MIVKKAVIILVVLLIIAGCARSEPINTGESEPEQSVSVGAEPKPVPNVPINTKPDTPESEADVYFSLKDELALNITSMETSPDPSNHAGEFVNVFVEMLGYRQSLEDFNETMDLTNDGVYCAGRIDVWPVFSYGGTNYRVVKLRVDTIANEKMYIQIYDDESIESQWIYEYQNEGGTEGKIVYCEFVHDVDKAYLVIIHEESSIDTSNSYYLVNYEINGYELGNYNALSWEFSNHAWTVSENIYIYYHSELKRTKITPMISQFPAYDCQYAFEYSIFAVSLNNKNKDEISLIFHDGFWVVDTASPSALTQLKAYYEAMAIACGWLDDHTDLTSYAIHDYSALPYEIPPPTYFLLGEEYYMFSMSAQWDKEPVYSHCILVNADTGELLSYYYENEYGSDRQQGTVIVETMDDWYSGKHVAYAPALLTADEAMAIYDDWMNDRFGNQAYSPEIPLNRESYGRYVIFGEQYYYFHAEDGMNYWFNLLVNMETGDLLFVLTTDGMFGEEYVMTMDDWLN